MSVGWAVASCSTSSISTIIGLAPERYLTSMLLSLPSEVIVASVSTEAVPLPVLGVIVPTSKVMFPSPLLSL